MTTRERVPSGIPSVFNAIERIECKEPGEQTKRIERKERKSKI